MFGCTEGLRAKANCVPLYSAVLRGSLFDMCVIVTSCECQLDFNKGLLLLLLLSASLYVSKRGAY